MILQHLLSAFLKDNSNKKHIKLDKVPKLKVQFVIVGENSIN